MMMTAQPRPEWKLSKPQRQHCKGCGKPLVPFASFDGSEVFTWWNCPEWWSGPVECLDENQPIDWPFGDDESVTPADFEALGFHCE